MIAIYTEILSICVFIIYMSVLDEYQFEFADQYDKECIEMRDFTIKSESLPDSF